MPLKNAEKTLQKAIQSVLAQKNTKRAVFLLIGNDGSTDDSEKIIQTFLPNPNILLLNVQFGSVYKNRNFLNHYARTQLSDCAFIGRLDADDVIYDEWTLRNIESVFDTQAADVVMCGNQQIKNGILLKWENKPSKSLLNEAYLLLRLFEMAQGNPKAELPSCNTFIKSSISVEYPDKISAEDHWFTVLLLLQKANLKICIQEELLYCIYSLDGFATQNNLKEAAYFASRIELYHFFKNALKS